MVNYQFGKIYKIVGNGLTYYGSTCEPNLARRLTGHRTDYKKHLNGNKKVSCKSFQILSTGDFQIVLVENFPCNTKDELKARERHWIENNECVNKLIPGRTKQEFDKIYRKRNIEILKQKANVQNICPLCQGTYTTSNKARHYKSQKHLDEEEK